MNLRRLEYFTAVAEERHFHRAASRLHIAQPALSVQVAKLEAELGVPLLDRNRRGVELTAAGAALLARLRLLLPSLRGALAEAADIGHGRGGRVVVGFVGSAAYQLLPAALRAAESEMPGAQIVLRQMTSPRQVEALAIGELDLAVTRMPSTDRALLSRSLLREEFVVALPAEHPLARFARLDADRLDGLPFVTLPADSGALYDAIVAELADAGATPCIIDAVTDMPALLGLVAAGRGVALVPASVSRIQLKGVLFRPLRSPKRRAELWLLARRDDGRPVIAALSNLLLKLKRTSAT